MNTNGDKMNNHKDYQDDNQDDAYGDGADPAQDTEGWGLSDHGDADADPPKNPWYKNPPSLMIAAAVLVVIVVVAAIISMLSGNKAAGVGDTVSLDRMDVTLSDFQPHSESDRAQDQLLCADVQMVNTSDSDIALEKTWGWGISTPDSPENMYYGYPTVTDSKDYQLSPGDTFNSEICFVAEEMPGEYTITYIDGGVMNGNNVAQFTGELFVLVRSNR